MYNDIKSYLIDKQQYYKTTCLLNKQTQSNLDILTQLYIDFCLKGLLGKIDGLIEQNLALKALRMLVQKKEL